MFKHYLSVGGVEIINSEATETYVKNVAPHLPFRPTYRGDRIHVALQDPEYRSPLIDGAPWANPNDLDSDDFFGIVPLSIDGIGDSTLTATSVEHMDDGGSANVGRHSSRTIKVSGLLVGATPRATQIGLTWLRAAVPASGCDNGDCGDGEMSYFLSEPAVTDHTWTDEVGSSTRSFGGQGVGQISYRWPESEVPVAMPARADWNLVATEGTTVRFGARARYSADTLQVSDPIQPRRVNYFPNPTVRADLSAYQITGASSAWYPTGGADGGSYGRVEYGEGTVGRLYGTGRYGVGVYGGGAGANDGGAQIVTSTSGDAPNGPVVASIALRGSTNQPVRLALSDASGTEVAVVQVKLSTKWARYSITAANSSGILRLSVTSPLSIDFDQALLEAGSMALPYFDGGVASADGYTASWSGVPDSSPSVQVWGGGYEVCQDDSDFRPFIDVLDGSLTSLDLEWWIRDEVPMNEVLQPYLRSYYQVACTQGPQIIQEFGGDDIGYYVQVEMLFLAGNPFAYSSPRTIPLSAAVTATHTDIAVVPQDDAWLIDPDCTPVTPPPRAPIIFDDCIDPISVWLRYHFVIPAEDVADWASSLPTLTFDSKDQPIKQVRIRFHPNPFDYEPQRVDVNSYCSEFSISYLPPTTRLEVNGVTRRAQASKTGKATVPANQLLYGTDGAPITWPELTCGIGYILTVDVPPSQDINLFDLELEMQRRE